MQQYPSGIPPVPPKAGPVPPVPPTVPKAGPVAPHSHPDRDEVETTIEQQRHDHRRMRMVISAIIAIVVAAIIFLAGILVGRLQDRFSLQRMNHGSYSQMHRGSSTMGMSPTSGGVSGAFGTPGMLGTRSGMQQSETNANGATGTISAINGNQVTVQGMNGVTTVVSVTAATVIHGNGQDLKITDLKTGNTVTVIGNPDSNGQIVATYINVKS